MTQPTGAVRIGNERYRQIHEEGYSRDGDIFRSQELEQAAFCYVAYNVGLEQGVMLTPDELGPGWPWDIKYWKPGTKARNIEKAGALLAAALDAMEEEDNDDPS